MRIIIIKSDILQINELLILNKEDSIIIGRDKSKTDKILRLKELLVSKSHASIYYARDITSYY